MGKVGKNSYIFHNVYIKVSSSVVGPKEYNGPIGNYFDKHYDTLYCNEEKSYEKAECKMYSEAIKIALKKGYLYESDVNAIIGGDLNNQIAISSYSARNFDIPFIGIFGACSNITLAMILGCNMLENNSGNIIAVTSSHNGCAERQFRYPTEYGAQRANTFTSTVTGACAIVLSTDVSPLKITKVTIGKVVDSNLKDPQDMGRSMAPAAYQTIKQHFNDFNQTINDYDLICTGDLSQFGKEFLLKLFLEDNIDISHKYMDTGLVIYNDKQNTMSGGSGCGCVGVVLASYLLDKLKIGEYKKILVCATGALMNPVMLGQKETIPGICHAVTIERV